MAAIFFDQQSTAISSTSNEKNDASVKLNLVLPDNGDNLPGNAAIRGAGTSQLTIILTIRQPGSASNKPYSIVKIYPINSSTEVQVNLSGLPAGLMVAKMQIEKGHIRGWTDFHGAGDLVSGSNNVDISPAGSRLPADILASTLQEVIKNDVIMAAAGSQIATNLKNALSTIDVNSENPYSKALDLVISQVNPTDLVKISFDNTTRQLTGTSGSTRKWQISYDEALGAGQTGGVNNSSFAVVRVVRHGLGSSAIVEWRDSTTLTSILTTHSTTDGQKQHTLANIGRFDQVVSISDTDLLVSGFNGSKKTPSLWRWNTSKDAFAEGLSVTHKNLEWEKYFTDEVYTNQPSRAGAVQNLILGAESKITAVIKLESGVIRSYLIAVADGSSTLLSPTSTVPNQLPAVSITAPTEGESFTTDNTITVTADASDPDGTASKVEFFTGNSLIGTANSSPWTISWSGMSAGAHALTARATDNSGFSKLSSPVNITITQGGAPVNQAPTISISSPASGSSSETGVTINIAATAADTDGTISKVEFYNGTTLLGTDETSPYSISFTPTTAGTLTLTAKAYDNLEKTTDSTAVSVTVTQAISGTGPELMISEVSSSKSSNTPRWMEVINKSSSSLNLSDYTIRTAIVPPAGGSIGKEGTFSIPSLTLEPGKMAVIRVKPDNDVFAGPSLVQVEAVNGNIPYWGDWGFIELKKVSTGATIDYVRWGTISTFYPFAPATSSEWSGDNATAMPEEFGYALVRNLSENDNNTATNWILRAFSTPGANNDVISDTDTDADGIPDANEAPGKTFCGLNYYDWGARAGVTDVFVHIDYMDSSSLSAKSLSMTPNKNALTRIVNAFKARASKQSIPIEVHFDVGSLFGNSVADFNLDGRSHKVSYTQKLDLSFSPGIGSAYSYKAWNMPLAKLPVFHYCLMGDRPNGDFSGLGEMFGNDFIITLGGSEFSEATTKDKNYLEYEHAATIMHELGHNLGLRHGGNEDTNYKPNYISIMNYMYSNYGLPVTGNSKEGDRYYYYRYNDVDQKSTYSLFKNYFLPSASWIEMHNNPQTDTVVMDFSDGTSSALNEASLNETTGFGRSGSAAVDFNGNGLTSDTGVSKDLNNDGTTGTISDFNDWEAISANFLRQISGVASIRASAVTSLPARRDWLCDDFQEVVPCKPVYRRNCGNH